MAERGRLDMEAFQVLMRAMFEEYQNKQTEAIKQLTEDINKKMTVMDKNLTDSRVELKQHIKEINESMDEKLSNIAGNLRQNIIDSTTLLSNEIRDTNTRIDTIENRFKKAIHEQDIVVEQESMELDTEIINIANEYKLIKQEIILDVTYQNDSHIPVIKHTQKQSTVIEKHAKHIIRKAIARNKCFAHKISMHKNEHQIKYKNNTTRRMRKARRKSYNKNKCYDEKYKINKKQHARSERCRLHHNEWTEFVQWNQGNREREKTLSLLAREANSKTNTCLQRRKWLLCVKHTIKTFRIPTRVNKRM